jgi:predicted 2-oxoglutarate/Fe(II)-dependent dioxygenase YbiX
MPSKANSVQKIRYTVQRRQGRERAAPIANAEREFAACENPRGSFVSKSKIVGKIVSALEAAKRPSAPWCEGVIDAGDLGLQIKGAGPVELPLRPAGVRQLRQVASQAPYGKRTETIVDPTVRDTLEIDAEAIAYSRELDEAIQEAGRHVAEHLHLEADRLRVELYKLLIYTKGGFFLPHRDSEKRTGMVATMIVVLPSRFGGGDLIVHHEGRRKVFSFNAAASQRQLRYAAFFADCEHEVKKVTSGVRACLAFNLILAPQRSQRSAGPASQANPQLLLQVKDWMRHRPADPLVFALEHQYTEAGLRPNLLKGADKELHRHVQSVAESTGCHLFFGQVS